MAASIKLNRSRSLVSLVAILVALMTLLNQRQDIALYVALALELTAIVLLTSHGRAFWQDIFATKNILAATVILALISNLSYFTADILTPFKHWLILLFPFLLVSVVGQLTSRNPQSIYIFVYIFSLAILAVLYKSFQSSQALEILQGFKQQTNWANALAALSPFVFIIKNNAIKRILLIAVIVGLIISLKRTGFLAIGILVLTQAISIAAAMFSIGSPAWKNIGSVIAGLVITSFSAIYFIGNQFFQDYLSRSLVRIAISNEDGGSGRLDIWSGAIDLIESANVFQFVFGRGFGWYNDYSQRLNIPVESLHNDFFDSWVSFGLLGASLYLILIFRLIYLMIFFLKNKLPNVEFAIASILIFIVYSIFSGVFFYIYFFAPLFVAIGYLEGEKSTHMKRST